MKDYVYKTSGVCAKQIAFSIEESLSPNDVFALLSAASTPLKSVSIEMLSSGAGLPHAVNVTDASGISNRKETSQPQCMILFVKRFIKTAIPI